MEGCKMNFELEEQYNYMINIYLSEPRMSLVTPV